MRVSHLNLVCVHLIRFVAAVNHAETFWNVSFIVHFLIVINQVAAQIIIALNCIHLHYLICVFVFLHCIDKGAFSN